MEIRSAGDIEWVKKKRGVSYSPDYYEQKAIAMCKERGYIFKGFVMPFNGSETKLALTCLEHGDWFSTNFESFSAGRGCVQCARDRRSNEAKKEFLKRLNDVSKNTKYRIVGVVGEWKGAKTKVAFECPEHGEWVTGGAWDYLKRGISCRKCNDAETAKSRRNGEDKVMTSIDKLCKENAVTFVGFVGGKYLNSKTKLILECNIHGERTENTTYGTFISRGICGCRGCKTDSCRIPESDSIQDAKSLCDVVGFKFLGWNGEYIGVNTKMNLECSHGVKWNSTTLLRFKQKPDLSCPCAIQRGYNTTKSGYLYIQKLTGEVSAIKFGISNHDPYKRMRDQSYKSKLEHEKIFSMKFDNGLIPLKIENTIKRKYKDKIKYVSRELMPDGYTETLPAEILPSFLRDVKNLCNINR